jgi:hypothetical protein
MWMTMKTGCRGRCGPGARASYDQNSKDELVYYMATYLGDPTPSGKTVISKTFVCPGYARYAPEVTSLMGRKVFLLNDDLDPSPLNRPAAVWLSGHGRRCRRCHRSRCRNLTIGLPPVNLFAVTDVDQATPELESIGVVVERPARTSRCMEAVRNQLFFDWHVQAVKW